MTTPRQSQIDAELQALGYQMEPSLSALDGQGHALIDVATGECVDPPNDHVLVLATEWSEIDGACAD